MSTAPQQGGVPSWLRDVPLAHRGLHGPGVAENSHSSFEAAVAAGYGVELDVHLSVDGVPVVIHDETLERLAGISGRVSALTADELAEVHLLGVNEGIPTLAEVLDVVRDTPTMIELKTSRLRAGRLEAAVAGLLEDHPGPACVASFNPFALRWLRSNAEHVVRVMTAMAPEGSGVQTMVLRRMSELRDLPSIRPVAVSYHLESLPHPAVDRWREDGGVVVTWTVTDEPGLRRAREVADNVIFEHVRPT